MGCGIIVEWRTNSTQFHRPWRASEINNRSPLLTTLGEAASRADVRVGSSPDLGALDWEVRFAPDNGLNSDIAACPKGAKRRHSDTFYRISNLASPSLTKIKMPYRLIDRQNFELQTQQVRATEICPRRLLNDISNIT